MPTSNATANEHIRRAQKPQRSYYMGTYPITKKDKVKLDLWFTSHIESLPEPSSNEAQEMGVIPSFPYQDVEIYGYTTDLPTLNVHDVWGCFLTPENVSEQMENDAIRYHAWVAALQVMEQYPEYGLKQESDYVALALRRFLVSLSLTLLDTFPGPVVTFVDTRFYNDTPAMVSEARALIALFDEANVRRGRVLITLPATEAGIRAAHELTTKYSIRIHLSMVTSLAHASACIEAGATMLSMNVGPIMSWFEKKDGDEVNYPIAPGHPGIEKIQSCIDYIHEHALNTSLLAVDIRNWQELKQLNGLGAAALDQKQLDQIPQHRLTTWFPDMFVEDCELPAYRRACEAEYPSNFLSRHQGSFSMAFTAQDRSLMSSVVYPRMGQNKVLMEEIEDIVRKEVRHRIGLEAFDLHPTLYRRKTVDLSPVDDRSSKTRRQSSKRTPRKKSKAHEKSSKNQNSGDVEDPNSLAYKLNRLVQLLGK
ncbi:hypothetical protein AZE42_04009 [Rhizopogon vesiculosus]|uniref:Uncharacterized protein n=1 Tax=Rhizopogon vesiculosus TaxID=180088 RepID=A0A1J8QF19_9AGAM|nr:hypothetical protein AZE42_04009 [Rhizopogon vesiculosus]